MQQIGRTLQNYANENQFEKYNNFVCDKLNKWSVASEFVKINFIQRLCERSEAIQVNFQTNGLTGLLLCARKDGK